MGYGTPILYIQCHKVARVWQWPGNNFMLNIVRLFNKYFVFFKLVFTTWDIYDKYFFFYFPNYFLTKNCIKYTKTLRSFPAYIRTQGTNSRYCTFFTCSCKLEEVFKNLKVDCTFIERDGVDQDWSHLTFVKRFNFMYEWDAYTKNIWNLTVQ